MTKVVHLKINITNLWKKASVKQTQISEKSHKNVNLGDKK